MFDHWISVLNPVFDGTTTDADATFHKLLSQLNFWSILKFVILQEKMIVPIIGHGGPVCCFLLSNVCCEVLDMLQLKWGPVLQWSSWSLVCLCWKSEHKNLGCQQLSLIHSCGHQWLLSLTLKEMTLSEMMCPCWSSNFIVCCCWLESLKHK